MSEGRQSLPLRRWPSGAGRGPEGAGAGPSRGAALEGPASSAEPKLIVVNAPGAAWDCRAVEARFYLPRARRSRAYVYAAAQESMCLRRSPPATKGPRASAAGEVEPRARPRLGRN